MQELYQLWKRCGTIVKNMVVKDVFSIPMDIANSKITDSLRFIGIFQMIISQTINILGRWSSNDEGDHEADIVVA